MGQNVQAQAAAAAIPLAGLSPAEPRHPSAATRILFTLAALLVYRLGTYIPLPGIDIAAWDQIFRAQADGILGVFDMLSGGSLHRMAIFALGILPYISAFIILQLIATVSPTLARLKRQGEVGCKIVNQYIRYLTVALAAFQAYGIAIGLESWRAFGPVVIDPGWLFRVTTVATLVGSAIFLMWLCEQMTSRGIGNGAF
jgi:preprotein translocase subunit SecY